MEIPDLTKLRWPFNLAIMAAIFSTVSLIYNDKYIYFGFITFIYGIIVNFYSSWFDYVYSDSLTGNFKDKRSLQVMIVNIIFMLAWIMALVVIYKFI